MRGWIHTLWLLIPQQRLFPVRVPPGLLLLTPLLLPSSDRFAAAAQQRMIIGRPTRVRAVFRRR